MNDLFNGLTGIVLGVIVIVGREKLAHSIIEYNNRVFRAHQGQREIKASVLAIVICGIALIIYGVSFILDFIS